MSICVDPEFLCTGRDNVEKSRPSATILSVGFVSMQVEGGVCFERVGSERIGLVTDDAEDIRQHGEARN